VSAVVVLTFSGLTKLLHTPSSIMVKSLDHHWQKPVDDIKGGGEADKDEPEASQLLDEEVSDTLGALLEQDVGDGEDDTISGNAKGVNGRGKALLSTYEPDKRCESWLKVKKDYIDGIGDSLDLVPIGGEC
jgi:DNA ligase-1